MGTVYARGSMLWIGFAGADGRWHYKSSGYHVGEEAKAKALVDTLEEQIRKGNRSAELGPLSVTEWGERWQTERLARVPPIWNAKHEWAAVKRHALQVPVDDSKRFGRMKLADVRSRHAVALVRGLRARGLAPRSVANIWGTVHKLFNDAVVQELLAGNPLVLPDTEQPRRVDADPAWRGKAVFSRIEAERLVIAPELEEHRRVLYAFGFLAGLREGEILDRRWRDYDPDTEPLGRLAVHSSFTRSNKRSKGTKTERPREVPVHPQLAAILAQWKLSGWKAAHGRAPKPDDFIVLNTRGNQGDDQYVLDGLAKDLELLGFRHRRFHDSRRTFISLALSDGANREVLKRVTHGAKGDILDQYTSFDWPTLCAAVAALKLGRKAHYSRSYKQRKSGG